MLYLGSGGTSRSNSILMTSNKHGEYSVDESQEKGSDEEGQSFLLCYFVGPTTLKCEKRKQIKPI